MAATTVGRELVAKAIIGETFTPFDAENAFLGVGSSSDAEDASQTDLVDPGAVRLAMEPGYPQRVGAVLTFRGIAGAGVANFDWNEFGIFNAADNGVMLRRMVRSLGTKQSGQIWAVQIQLEVGQ